MTMKSPESTGRREGSQGVHGALDALDLACGEGALEKSARPARGARKRGRALAMEPDAAWAQNNVCDVEFRMGRLEEARTRCQTALALAPGFKAAHNNLALVLAASGDLDGARREFLAGGDVASASYNLGIVHLAGREYASAADAFEEAIRQRPGYTAAKARAHAARLRLLIGE